MEADTKEWEGQIQNPMAAFAVDGDQLMRPDPYMLPPQSGQAEKTEYDSLDYDTCYNVPYKKQLKSYTKYTYWHISVMRWVLVAIIGILTGAIAFVISICVEKLVDLKYTQFEKVYHALLPGSAVPVGLLVLLGFNVFYTIIPAVVSVFEPLAGGSGVPELMCYLNGVKIPHIIQMVPVLAKGFGLVFSIAAGFFVGPEGPLLYMGAVIGSGVSQLQSFLPFLNKYHIPYPYFRSDREKRDFISSGAAAGVAAAFGAPIGGTLFSLEEGSSFWNQSLTWRTLFCSLCATFTFNFVTSIYKNIAGQLGQPGLVNFGTDVSAQSAKSWRAQHLIIFIIMGAIGGLLGALFNSLNTHIAKYRRKLLMKKKSAKWWRALEAVLIISATTLVTYISCIIASTCVPRVLESVIPTDYENLTLNYFCPEGDDNHSTHYHNDFATLILNRGELSITQIFHLSDAYSVTTLGIGLVVYFLLACWTLGVAVPSGLFVPCILIGAMYGHLFPTLLKQLSTGELSTFVLQVYPGTYAIIGAAAFMGGVMRMTISLTVILIETTQQISYGLPIMVTLMVAKWVGDLFNDGIYHTSIHLKNIPFLDEKPPDQLDSLLAQDVMSENVSFLYPITRVGSLVQLLRSTAHSAFPVVTPLTSQAKPLQNISNKHVPALYREDFTLSGPYGATRTKESSPFDEANLPKQHGRYTRTTFTNPPALSNNKRTIRRRNETTDAEMHDGDGLAYDYTIPPTGVHVAEEFHTQSMRDKTQLVLHGIILRTQLVQLLKNRVFFSDSEQPENQPELTHQQMMDGYPRFSSVDDIDGLSADDENKLMDITLYMNPGPYTVSNQATLPQVFTLFRTMGLRHLPVVKASGVLVGIITRHDLAHHKLLEIIEENKHANIARVRYRQL